MSPTIYKYPVTNTEAALTISRALELLRPHLPQSLPIFRRLQFGRFFDATCLLSSVDLTLHGNEQVTSSLQPWALAFVDRSCRPETEVWLFGTWETSSPPSPPATDESGKANNELVLALAVTMKALPLPLSIHDQASTATNNGNKNGDRNEQDTGGHTRTDYANHATNVSIMLWGAIHSSTFHILQRLDLLSPQHKAVEEPNHTFLFDIASLPSQPSVLPEGLQWGKVKPQDFELIKSRTQIPRQTRTMAILPSLAVYPIYSPENQDVTPIAWAFIGLDSSLTTLHVEPTYRGRGLAKMITSKIFREEMNHFNTRDDVVDSTALGYVQVGNKASEGMCRSLGGKADWECYWLRVDLSRAGR